MYNIGDYVLYKRDVCKVKNIKKRENVDYYELEPIDDNSLKIEIPVNNKLIKDLIDKEEIKQLITKISSIDIIECNDKLLESEYKKLLSTGNKEDLIRIIKTTYLRNKERLDNKKKISDKDNTYFQKAERILYNEFSIVLNMTYDETKEYIINQVEKMEK